jgi:uncharacterized protein (TIGR02118 family)
MYCLTVTYPKREGSTFDHEYYVSKHIPLCARLFADHGFQGTVLRSEQGAAPGAADQNYASVDILFDSPESMSAALKAGGKQVSEDLKNYTDVQPVMAFSAVTVAVGQA